MNVRKGVTAGGLALAMTVTGIGINSSTAFAGDRNSHDKSWDRHSQSHDKSRSHGEQPLTLRAKLTATVSGVPGQAAPLSVTADGAIDYANGQGEFTLVAPGADGTTMESTQLIVDGTSAYVQVPEDQVAANGGKGWIKADAAETAQSMGFDLGMFDQTGNPMNGLETLQSMGTDVTPVGKEIVDGVKTKHYKVTLDFAAAAAKESDPTKKAALEKIAALYGNEPLMADVWIDRKDRLRKMTFGIDLSKLTVAGVPADQLTGTIDVTAEFSDFGTPVNVDVPDESEVATVSVPGSSESSTDSSTEELQAVA